MLLLCSYFKEPVFSPASNIVHTRLNPSMGISSIGLPFRLSLTTFVVLLWQRNLPKSVVYSFHECFVLHVQCLSLQLFFILSFSFVFVVVVVSRVRSAVPSQKFLICDDFVAKTTVWWKADVHMWRGSQFRGNALASISEFPLSSPGLEEMCNHLFFA